MPIKKSAKKALRQSEKRRTRNRAQKQTVKNLLKKIRALVSEKKPQEAEKILPRAYKALDKAAKTNLMKKNTVSRTKSRLAKAVLSAAKAR